jgi:hypothetical protein
MVLLLLIFLPASVQSSLEDLLHSAGIFGRFPCPVVVYFYTLRNLFSLSGGFKSGNPATLPAAGFSSAVFHSTANIFCFIKFGQKHLSLLILPALTVFSIFTEAKEFASSDSSWY